MTGPIFDTHAHYSARAFDADLLRIGELFFRHQDNRILKSS